MDFFGLYLFRNYYCVFCYDMFMVSLTSNRGQYRHSWGCLTSWPHSTVHWLSFDMFTLKIAKQMAELFHGTYLKIDSKNFLWRKWYLMSGHGVILDDPGQLELDTIIEIWRSLEGFSWVANLMAAMAKLYFPEWPRPTSTRWTRGGPPPWLSPWRAWDQNKSCLAWWADHFDVFFDRVRPPPSGHEVGLLCGYHPGGLGTKTKDA